MVNVITPTDLSEWINYLASDRMKGRANGSAEMVEAANWIASKFSEYGVKPFKDYPNYFQHYSTETRGGGVINEKNVIGFIPGSNPDPGDEFIVLTAHFDHVGIRTPIEGDSIYNGADDNGAGTCTLIGIAKAFKEAGYVPGRGIIFAAVSGEEIGLRGSRYLVKNMPVPIESVYANLNFEMIGHSEYLGPGNYYMTGTELSNLDDIIQQYHKGGSITLVDTIALASRLFYMSDNAAFARYSSSDGINSGIPCGTFATTTFADHIHSPFDEPGLFDFDNMAVLVNYFAFITAKLSNSEEEIDWTSDIFRRPPGKK